MKEKKYKETMVIKSLQQAFRALFSFRTWFLVLMPPLLTGFVLSILFVVYWNPLSHWAASVVGEWGFIKSIGAFLRFPDVFTSIFSSSFLILLFFPILFVTVLLVTSIFVTPIVQREVAVGYFKDLEKKKGGSVAGSLWNSFQSLVIFVFFFVVTFPLWLIPGLQLVIPAFLIIWLNKKIFVYDVLQDFASKEERKQVERYHSPELWALGALLVVFSYIPLAFVFLPVFSAFAYSFFALNALKEQRNPTSSLDF